MSGFLVIKENYEPYRTLVELQVQAKARPMSALKARIKAKAASMKAGAIGIKSKAADRVRAVSKHHPPSLLSLAP